MIERIFLAINRLECDHLKKIKKGWLQPCTFYCVSFSGIRTNPY